MISTLSSTSSASSGGTSALSLGPGGAMGKDQFLKMLVAQLQNQDPLNPMQGDQMAAQLAQFSSLEQLIDINKALGAQQSSQNLLVGSIQVNAAIGTIGKTAIATGDGLVVGPTGPDSVMADIGAAGGTAVLRIYDDSGREVSSVNLGTIGGGRQTIPVGEATGKLAPGTYHFAVDVKDPSGKPVDVQTYMSGKVDGVKSGAQGLTLTAGSLEFPYGAVIQIIS